MRIVWVDMSREYWDQGYREVHFLNRVPAERVYDNTYYRLASIWMNREGIWYVYKCKNDGSRTSDEEARKQGIKCQNKQAAMIAAELLL